MADSIEVKVVKAVDMQRLIAQANKRMLTACVRQASNRAIGRSPVDKGTLRKSLNPQGAKYDGASIPSWAEFGPKVNAVPYAGYLNAGSYVRKSGKPAPGAPLRRWAGRKGIPAGSRGVVVRSVQRKQARRGTFVLHYVSGPMKGKATKGWFDPGVRDDMQNLQDVENIVRDTATWIASKWASGGVS